MAVGSADGLRRFREGWVAGVTHRLAPRRSDVAFRAGHAAARIAYWRYLRDVGSDHASAWCDGARFSVRVAPEGSDSFVAYCRGRDAALYAFSSAGEPEFQRLFALAAGDPAFDAAPFEHAPFDAAPSDRARGSEGEPAPRERVSGELVSGELVSGELVSGDLVSGERSCEDSDRPLIDDAFDPPSGELARPTGAFDHPSGKLPRMAEAPDDEHDDDPPQVSDIYPVDAS